MPFEKILWNPGAHGAERAPEGRHVAAARVRAWQRRKCGGAMSRTGVLLVLVAVAVAGSAARAEVAVAEGATGEGSGLPVFEPEEEWKEVLPGQSIPAVRGETAPLRCLGARG